MHTNALIFVTLFFLAFRANTFPAYQPNADLMREPVDYFSAPPVLLRDEPEEPQPEPELPRPHTVPVIREVQEVVSQYVDEEMLENR